MSARVVIPLAEFSRFSAAAIGARGVKLGQYDSLGIPLPISFCIPQSVFSQLINENQLIEKLNKIKKVSWKDPTSRNTVKEMVRSTIEKQELPDWFTDPLLQIYHSEFQRGFIRLFPGEQRTLVDVTRFEHIQGDANFFESLLRFWSTWAEHQLDLNRTLNRATLTPDSIIIQEQTQADASGYAYTQHPTRNIKSQVYIEAIKGCPDEELLDTQADHFAVDVRSWNVVYKNVQAQPRMVHRTSDDLESIPLAYANQLSPALSEQQCMRLAQFVQQLKHHNFEHVKIGWEHTPKGFMFTSIEPLTELSLATKKTSLNTLTKIYISGGNPHKSQILTSSKPDGIGVLRSEYTYAEFGIHPSHIVHSRHREVLERKLAHAITSYQEAVGYKRVVFRSDNLHSAENLQLDHAHSYEPEETNPYLGFRGGLRLATYPELLRIEISAIQAALSKQAGQIGYMFSFVRTPEELSNLVHQVEKAGLTQRPQFELWWQINTPENILNLRAYPLHKLQGISINIKTVQALLHGIDPDDPELFERYQLDTDLIASLLENVATVRNELSSLRPSGTSLLIHLHLEDFSRDLVASAVKLRYDGIVVKPRALEIAREVVLEQEETLLMQ